MRIFSKAELDVIIHTAAISNTAYSEKYPNKAYIEKENINTMDSKAGKPVIKSEREVGFAISLPAGRNPSQLRTIPRIYQG
jgi:hypothetical protein